MNSSSSVSSVGSSTRRARARLADIALLTLVCLLGAGGHASASIGFQRSDFSTGSAPIAVATADLNGDGKLDIATANSVSSIVTVLHGDGAGGFGFYRADFLAGIGPTSVAMGDLNGDGKPDLAVTNREASTVSVLLNVTPAGSETADFVANDPAEFVCGFRPYWVATGDLNGDGRLDLVTANFAAPNSVSILLNSTSAGATLVSFVPKYDFTTGNNPVAVAIGDLNGDGKPDVATANYVPNTASVLLNATAAGAMVPDFEANSPRDFATGTTPGSVAIADLDCDGRSDLITGNYGSGTASVLLNTTPGGSMGTTFASKADFAVGSGSSAVVIGDVNRDGRLDVATANYNANTASLLLNVTPPGASVPRFVDVADFTIGHAPVAIVSGDFDRDGRLDLATANYGSNGGTVLLNTSTESPGPLAFGTNTWVTGTRSVSVALADLNRDGRLDVVTANRGADAVSVLLGDGAGGLGVPTGFTTGSGPAAVAIDDLNRDGRPDLAVANADAGTVSVLLGQGGGSFEPKVDFPAGAHPRSIAIGDLSRDGRLDLVVANADAHTLTVLLGDGAGAFAPGGDLATGARPTSVAIGDLSGDGRADLAAANADANTVSVWLGDGMGGFGVRTDYASGGSPAAVAFGDVNRDGRLDLVAANSSANTVSVLLGNGAGGLGARNDFSTGGFPVALGMAEVSGDGAIDLAVANHGDHTVSLLFGYGDGGFGVPMDFPTADSACSVAIGDLNRDGKPDLAVATDSPGAVSVLLNTTPYVAVPREANPAEVAFGVVGPNPSPAGVRFWFSLPVETRVRVRVFDVMGRGVADPVQGVFSAGRHEASWTGAHAGRPVGAGVYFACYEAAGSRLVRRVVMAR